MRTGTKTASQFDVQRIRADFPALAQTVHGYPLVYLDNAATSQKPRVVIDEMMRFYTQDCANVHRGVHLLSERSTAAYEGARETVRRFLNARSTREIVFTRGATEAVNLVAQTYGRANVGPGDEILITALEHHSNIVPWQMLAEEKQAVLRVAPVDDRGEVILEEFERLIGPRTKIVALAHVSNALGTINPAAEMVRIAHREGAVVLVDGAQAVPHMQADMRRLDCDFYVFSGHKTFGPTGIGVLYGKAALLEAMPPWQGGGDMIRSVTFEKTLYNDLPYKFEAGTPHIAGAIGLGAALDYMTAIGMDRIAEYEHELLEYGTEALLGVEGVRLIGTARKKAAVLSFVMEGVHPHDIATILDRRGIAIRAGHHCAQPIMERFGVPATSRVSLAFYNTRQEIDALVEGLGWVKEVFA
ncbi:MAG TPA: cysteine desulfurase [Bryobacteraceae bacterium]|nr:cysteine desulfurase [Bryobacteraceae bacterium]HOL73526.1 cysteine desulfurase [Bryobacteraceae bacterium]HOQ46858.1 cysteine desulfurase [Bryobacteraceae bacterium]HPQ14300.1 cysteine desulfurase [Bryobacteraceae bacterium]HPU72983.1 cysteine desulfurase [Bryobacteraceae bacterium]